MSHTLAATRAIAGLLLGLAVATDASAIALGTAVPTANPLVGSGCATPAAKSSFAATDAGAFVWLAFTGAASGDTVEWRFFDPSDALHTESLFTVDFDGDGCAWSQLLIAGQPAALLPGQWTVDVHLNGAFATTVTFSIAGGATTTTTTLPPSPSGSGAARLDFVTNEQVLVPWGYVRLGYRLRSFQPGIPVDVHVALLRDGGGPQCIAPELVFATALPPVAANVALANLEAAVVDGFLPAGFDDVASKVYGVVVGAGTSPADPANWLSNLAVLDLAMGALSADQLDLIAARGNPQAYVVQLFYDTKQRVETWIYDGGGLGRIFQFVNGRPVARDDDDERAAATAGGPPVFFGPGRFGPATTPAEVRALLGDPDRVVAGAAGTQLWVFEDAQMAVTVQAGLVRQIEAH